MTAWLATEWRPSAWWLSGQACDPRSCSRTLHYPGILQLALRSGHYLVTCKLSSGDREGSGDLTSNSRGVVVSIPGYSDLWNARAHGIACELPENGECPRNRVNSSMLGLLVLPIAGFGESSGNACTGASDRDIQVPSLVTHKTEGTDCNHRKQAHHKQPDPPRRQSSH